MMTAVEELIAEMRRFHDEEMIGDSPKDILRYEKLKMRAYIAILEMLNEIGKGRKAKKK